MKPHAGLASLVLVLLASGSPSQTAFTPIPTPPPGPGFTNGSTERLVFGDLDLDGDLDVVLADGGDAGNQRNRVWINLGGLQGGTIGTFADESATRWPNVADSSRNVELADIDGDGDLDAHVSNHSTFTSQSNRWIVNMGGSQGGTFGFFQDETAARWVGLGQGPGPGHPYLSSIPPSVLTGLNPPGGFRDWSCESSFGDVDNDGDLDLLHASYGAGFNGQVPTRIFLNDGDGYFSEFNPSGFALSGFSIANGDPALWCEGVQQHNTTDTTGQFADVATHQLAAMFADLDNDLDLDVFLGSRDSQPRAFFNRLEETGNLIFRDVTAFVYSVAAGAIGGHYEQNLADLDNDGDLDAYLLNYGLTTFFSDHVAFNDGTGRLVNFLTLPNSAPDFNEADFLDLENDGDLDVVVATFASPERVYVNAFVPSGTATFTELAGFASLPGTSLDVDAADLDGDGDTDLGYAMDNNMPEVLLRNDLVESGGPADAWAPRVLRLEQAPNRPAGSAPTAVRVQVYDNAPFPVLAFTQARLLVAVDGCPMPDPPMRWSGGQVFRGEIPGAYIGTVAYTALATDSSGNTGIATTLAGAPQVFSYAASGNKNVASYGLGTAGTGGAVPSLDTNGPAAAGNAAFALCVSNGLPAGGGCIAISLLPLVPGANLGFLLHVDPAAIAAVLSFVLDASGRRAALVPVPLPTPPGQALFAQFFGADPAAPSGISSSNALAIGTTPPLP